MAEECYGPKDSTLDVLCSLLKSWGNCNDDLVDYMRDSKLSSPEKIQETLARALNPDLLKDMINEQRLKKMEKQDDDQEEEEKAS